MLEATAFQTKDMFDAMELDAGISIPSVKVDGGMVVNELLMQFQADVLDRPVVRPGVIETTALGAAYAAGLGSGFSKTLKNWQCTGKWTGVCSANGTYREEKKLRYWKKAVERSFSRSKLTKVLCLIRTLVKKAVSFPYFEF